MLWVSVSAVSSSSSSPVVATLQPNLLRRLKKNFITTSRGSSGTACHTPPIMKIVISWQIARRMLWWGHGTDAPLLLLVLVDTHMVPST